MFESSTATAFDGSSFRDPAGYIFRDGGVVKRIVTRYGASDYRMLMDSGLYGALVQESLLVPHEEEPYAAGGDVAAVLVPEAIPYISYPYEWSFGQVRDAALLTLRVQEMAMRHGMSLKDATAFNVQFRGSRPVFIDTLSFEPNDGGPWPAYNQFCRHFLGPLMLMSYVAPDINQFWKASLDGFPLSLVSSLLPRKTYLRLGALLHIHLHARTQKKFEGTDGAPARALARPGSGPDRKPALVDSLRAFVKNLKSSGAETEWLHYYDRKASHYSNAAEQCKKRLVEETVRDVNPRLVYDLGGNIGEYSRIASASGAYTICFDIDPLCVHHNYERARDENTARLLPLLLDLTNPTPSLGFGLRERESLVERGSADLVMALALLHHLRITGNAPLENIAAFLARMSKRLLLEFVPKTDVMAQALLRSRKDTFHDYTEDGFRSAFDKYFEIERTAPVAETDRTMYLFRRREA